jgi:hypothetical protein
MIYRETTDGHHVRIELGICHMAQQARRHPRPVQQDGCRVTFPILPSSPFEESEGYKPGRGFDSHRPLQDLARFCLEVLQPVLQTMFYARSVGE